MFISLLLVVIVSAAVVVSGFKKQPGIGITFAALVIATSVWINGTGLRSLGFFAPSDWRMTILLSIVLGGVIQLASTIFIEPLSDKLTNSVTDHSVFESLRGNVKNLLIWLLTVWVLVAFLEETIFRGFLMSELANITGKGMPAMVINLILSSVIFGLAHWYQGKSGTLSTAIIGALMGILFILSGYNLWLPLLTHGFIDTVGLTMIYLNLDKKLKKLA
ncbi:MAG: CPBP family intramembrane glutamic endopeptidase [Chloroflexota bacterium]